MIPTIKYRLSQMGDLIAIKALLSQSDLPVTDIDENKIVFIVAVNDKNVLIGCIGLERYGADALLRSLAVDSGYRSKGIGHELFYRLLSTSRQYSVKNLHLLTTTAETFFASSGFSVAERNGAPVSIKATAEFSSVCPSSSIYMVMRDIHKAEPGKAIISSTDKTKTIAMNTNAEIKNVVREKYAEIATQSKNQNQSSCCGASACCSDDLYNIMADDYTKLEGYNPDADLGLGCGLPTVFAKIKEGNTVIDLGSGAGNDAFVARKAVGEAGKVIGVDFTGPMIAKARENAERFGFNNVEFRQGDIEDLPVTSNKADVIVSNCVLNLVPNKHKVFSEIYRVLKPGAHFSISDIVLEGELPSKWKEIAEMYAGCISGAIQKKEYLGIIEEAGFKNITIQKDKTIVIPDDILKNYFNDDEVVAHRLSNTRIASITVFAEKPAKDERNCCEPGSGCC